MNELPGGIRRLTFPLPMGIRHVHCYLLPGDDGWTLVDTGLGVPQGQERWGAVGQVARVVVTHFHPDHAGTAEITPTTGLSPASRPDPLGDYLASPERTIELAPQIALPGHGEQIGDPAGRVREIQEHHRIRLDETAAALGEEPRTAYEVSLALFGDDLDAFGRRFALAETLAHLERLIREGRAARAGDDNNVSYTAA